MSYVFSQTENVIVSEDPVTITDGLFISKSASLEISPKLSPIFIESLMYYLESGAVKIKLNKVVKRRDWIKV